MKTVHTHRGTCQGCGSQQAVNNESRLIAEHGYKVQHGHFQYVCTAAKLFPAEYDLTYTHNTIANCLAAAASHEAVIATLKSGEFVPPTFQRWNPSKVKYNKSRYGAGSYRTVGDYDQLPIEQATQEERAKRIEIALRDNEMKAKGFRDHAKYLTDFVLPRFGQPLYVNEELGLVVLRRGLTFTHEGCQYELMRPVKSTFANRILGWYVMREGAPKGSELRWTSKQIREAMNPKPVIAASGYKTKKARQDDLDKLNRVFEQKLIIIRYMYLELPQDERTQGKTAVYYSPVHLSHWRPKHSAAVLKEFPAAASLVQDIEALVAERARIKAAPGA